MANASILITDPFGTAQKSIRLMDNGDGTFSLCITPQPSSFQNILTATTTTVKSGAGILDKIIFNKLVALSVITIYDNTAASGTKIATITNPAALLQNQIILPFGIAFSTGLTIVTSGIDDITVAYR